MTAPTTQIMLDNVRIAINTRIANGAVQSYGMPGGRNLQTYSLTEMMELEKTLMARLGTEQGYGRNYGAFNNI